MIELLLEGWCEPPKPQALHLSMLVHQILSVVAERGGAQTNRLYRVLCQEGPFRQVSTRLFLDALRAKCAGEFLILLKIQGIDRSDGKRDFVARTGWVRYI